MASEYDGLVGTGRLNTENLLDIMGNHTSIAEFLRDEEVRFSFHATHATELEQEILIEGEFDFDGVVVDLNCFSAIKSPIFYLLLDHEKVEFNQPAYHLLKKHIGLSTFNVAEIERLKRTRSFNIGYTNGWRVTLTLMPTRDGKGNCFETAERAKSAFREYVKRLCCKMIYLLENQPPAELRRPSLRKNASFRISNMNVLPQDQEFILSLLDRAVLDTELEVGTEVLIFASKFGMKDKQPLTLSGIFFMDQVRYISVHTACTLSAEYCNTHILWARHGLYEIVGRRGRFFGCLGIREAANFQSNLDARAMDISANLLNIAKYPENMTFIQLYADTPHLHTDLSFPNPVSGSIATCGLLHHKTTKALGKRAETYLKTLEDNARKLVGLISSRVEIVSIVPGIGAANTFTAGMFFNIPNLCRLMKEHCLVLPFSEGEGDRSFTQKLRDVAFSLCKTLREISTDNIHGGGYVATWKCFQLELALESFFYGKTLAEMNEIYSTNLGPGMSNERSLTLQRGFLGLDLPNASALPTSPPPLSLWTRNENQKKRINRVFGLSDHLESCDAELGRRLITILLLDLYDTSILPIHTLKMRNPPANAIVKGSVAREHLATLIVDRRLGKYPFTFGRALAIAGSRGRDNETVLLRGLVEIDINYFPAVKLRDVHGNPRLTWNKRDYWEIVRPHQALSIAAKAGEVSSAVVVEMVNRGLTYARNVEAYKDTGMPWLMTIINRLQEQRLSQAQLIKVCTFLSCVAFLQQHLYIDYNKLGNLELDLPISQHKMRQLEIQSHRLLSGLNRVRIWRLNERIPIKYRFPSKHVAPKSNSEKEIVEEEEPPDEEQPEMMDDEDNQQDVHRIAVRTVPKNHRGRWTCQELALLEMALQLDGADLKSSYQAYVKFCCNKGIPSRGFDAFKHKSLRFKRDKT
ncbi:hypothetical protein SNE40_017417 [Patella caerulea]|uniref:Uncharacterized protein n=1 Tax=Patella caerulea TaxID=87958 RepID=A0AAN8G4N5_PATCE